MRYSAPLIRLIALSLIAAVLMPSVFFMEAPKAHAIIPVFVDGTVALPYNAQTASETAFTAVKSAIDAVANVANQVNTYLLVLDKWVLEPLAFIESGQLLRSITAGVILFVDGVANATGVPQFVQSLSYNLQAIADTQAFSFFSEYGALSNSPFASSIVYSLNEQYLQDSSLGGFFAANQCTLTGMSGFMYGNWSQGGAAAWFALTTQPQNNPYMLFLSSQAQLSVMTTGSVNGELNQLAWGQGMLSWCGSANTLGGGIANPTTDTCTQSDGTPGVIKTPGSVIADGLQQALGTTIDKLVQMGQVGPEINTILGTVMNAMETLSFGQQLLGGSNSGGLAGLAYGGSGSLLNQYQNQSGYLGVTNNSVLQNSATAGVGSGLASRISGYQTAWNSIAAATNNASTSVAKLITACSVTTINGMAMPSSAHTTLTEAQSAMATEIAPVARQIDQASTTIANAQQFEAQIQADSAAGNTSAYTADLAASQTTAPTTSDVANAQQQATSFGTAQANASNPLSVTASSFLDQMNLISSNAAGLINRCTPVSSASVSSYYGRGS